MANTGTDHMTCVAQNLRGLTHFRSDADDIDALADERDQLRVAIAAARERLGASLFTNSEHSQAIHILEKALKEPKA